jgi:hypothetical protein
MLLKVWAFSINVPFISNFVKKKKTLTLPGKNITFVYTWPLSILRTGTFPISHTDILVSLFQFSTRQLVLQCNESDGRCTKFADYLTENYVTNDSRFPPKLWAEKPSANKCTTNGPEPFHCHYSEQFYSTHPAIFVFLKTILEQVSTLYQNSLHWRTSCPVENWRKMRCTGKKRKGPSVFTQVCQIWKCKCLSHLQVKKRKCSEPRQV